MLSESLGWPAPTKGGHSGVTVRIRATIPTTIATRHARFSQGIALFSKLNDALFSAFWNADMLVVSVSDSEIADKKNEISAIIERRENDSNRPTIVNPSSVALNEQV